MIKTAAEAALAKEFAQARARLPGDDASRRSAPPPSICSPSKACRIAASRNGNIPTARADARGKAAGEPARCRGQGRAPRPRDKCSGDVETRRIVFVDGAFVPELSDTAALERGLTVGSLAAALADRDPALTSNWASWRRGAMSPSRSIPR